MWGGSAMQGGGLSEVAGMHAAREESLIVE